jgi:hypothetical protein
MPDVEKVEALVLRDDQGRYDFVSRELVEQCRVPEEQVADLEQQLAGDDVRGYLSGNENPTESISFNFTKINKIEFGFFVQAPRDIATGQASGKRQS